jgi:hypothetical protein
MRAWLITWEWNGDHAKVDNPLVSILSSRYSPERVRLLVEQLYINDGATASEHIAYARNKKNNPYPAYYNSSSSGRHTWQIYCGHNPHLYARLVFDLKHEGIAGGKQKLTWKENPRPNSEWIALSLEISQ